MAIRQRLFLLSSLIVLAAFAPRPAAQPADVLASGPDALLDDAQQGTPDPDACVAKCAAVRDREVAWADKTLKERGFYSMFSSNCTEEKGQPKCVALRQTCREACGPKYETACTAACETPLQSCCYANKVAIEKVDYDACVNACPMSKASIPGAQAAPPSAAASAGKGAAIDKKAEWASMFKNASTMLEALAPGMDDLDLDRFNNLRRMLAFTQVSATLGQNDGKFAMVSGGDGRIWIIGADGRQTPLSKELAATLRGEGVKGAGQQSAIDDLEKKGLTHEDAVNLVSSITMYDIEDPAQHFSSDFKPGAVWYFPKNSGWSDAVKKKATASSEHSSIRGTINGGGDFI